MSLGLTYTDCEAIDLANGSRQAIGLLQQAGARFVRRCDLDPDPDPISGIKPNGTLHCNIRHPALNPNEFTASEVDLLGVGAREWPYATLGCYPSNGHGPTRAITLDQATGFLEEELTDHASLGLVRLALILYPFFRPRYGYLDEYAAGQPSLTVYLRDEIPCLFWANIFGPDHVERLGREFLRNAPGWRLVEFPDGGVMHIASESYMEWWHRDFTELRDYFRQRLPQIELFRGQQSEYS